MREQVRRTADGRVAGLRRLERDPRPTGAGSTPLLDVGEAAGGTPLTWLVDPAVLDAVARLADGNPPRTSPPDPAAVPDEGDEEPDRGPDAGRGRRPSPTPDLGGAPMGPPAPDRGALRRPAGRRRPSAAGLARPLRRAGAGETVLALPYGDLDVAAAAAHGPAFYTDAVAAQRRGDGRARHRATPALAPPAALISRTRSQAATAGDARPARRHAFADPPDAPSSMVRRGAQGGRHLVGRRRRRPRPDRRRRPARPAPADPRRGRAAPVAGGPPRRWSRAPRRLVPARTQADFFDGLDVPWLDPVAVTDISARPAAACTGADLSYTEEDAAAELGADQLRATQELRQQAAVMSGGAHQQRTSCASRPTDEALATLSVRAATAAGRGRGVRPAARRMPRRPARRHRRVGPSS